MRRPPRVSIDALSRGTPQPGRARSEVPALQRSLPRPERATPQPVAPISRRAPLPEITVAYICGRKEPRIEWMLDSLCSQITGERIHVIIVDFHGRSLDGDRWPKLASLRTAPPKPTIWQGPHRITRDNWWAKSSSSNTAIVLCETPWLQFLDDRLVLAPGWLARVREAATGQYVVCGSYEKRVGMRVEGGTITELGSSIGVDPRRGTVAHRAPGSWLFGCNFGLPLEWVLAVNGFEEGVDGLASEDSIFGKMLENAGYPIRYDAAMRVVEDRSQETGGSDVWQTLPTDRDRVLESVDCQMRRIDKGRSPVDKSHAALARFATRRRTDPAFTPDLRTLRARVRSGAGFPVPDPSGDYRDWYDNQPIREMT